jgi:hypothetical protein
MQSPPRELRHELPLKKNEMLREIDARIAAKKIEMFKKELERMDADIVKIKRVNAVYDALLMKNEPVGAALNVVRKKACARCEIFISS